MLRISMLGAPQIEVEGQRIATFESRTADAVLYYLAINGGVHTRESLAEFFWPERTQTQSLSNLRTVLHRLRRLLEPYLEITRSAVKLNEDAGVWIDAAHLLRVFNEIDINALSATTAAHLNEALVLYRGPLLDGFYLRECPGFEDWLRRIRESWQILMTDVLDALIGYYLRSEEYIPAMAHVEQLIRTDPFREQAYGLKMRLLASLGQPDKALDVYRNFEAILLSELDDAPSPELQRLFDQIRAEQSGYSTIQRLTLKLAAMTQQWNEAERHADYLATGKVLEHLEALLIDKVGLSEMEREFIGVSLDKREQFLREERAKQNEERALRLALEATRILDHGQTGEVAALLAINSLELSYTASADAVLLRALNRPLLRRRFGGHDFRTIYITVSADGRFLLTAGADKTVRLWDTHTGATLQVISDFDSHPKSLTFSPDSRYYAGGGSGHILYIRAVGDGEITRILTGHHAPVQCAAWSQDGLLLASGDSDGVLHIWQAQSNNLMHVITHASAIEQLCFTHGHSIVYVVMSNAVTLWHLEPLKRIRLIETGQQRISAVLPFSSRNHLLIGTQDGSIQQWDCSTGQMIDMLRAQTTAVVGLWEEDEQIIAVHQNGQMQAWQLDNDAPLWTRTYPQKIQTVARSADNQSLFVGGSPNGDFYSFVWQTPIQSEPRVLTGHRGGVTTAEFSPDGTLIASSSWDSTVRIWDTASGRVVRVLQHPQGHALKAVTFAPDGRSVVSSCDDSIARLWDVETGELLQVYEGHSGAITGVAFSRNGDYILTGSHDRTMRLWDAVTGEEIRRFAGHDGAVYRVRFSPDDSNLALSPSADHTVRLWDIHTGEVLKIFVGHTGWVTGTAFSPDGRTLVTTSFDHTARLWDVASGTCKRIFTEHTALVRHAVFSPDGRLFATGSEDRTMRLCDAVTGEQVRVFTGHADGLWQMGFSPVGQTIASPSADCTIRIWHIQLRDVIALAREMLSRDLSPAERSEYGIISPLGATFPDSASR